HNVDAVVLTGRFNAADAVVADLAAGRLRQVGNVLAALVGQDFRQVVAHLEVHAASLVEPAAVVLRAVHHIGHLFVVRTGETHIVHTLLVHVLKERGGRTGDHHHAVAAHGDQSLHSGADFIGGKGHHVVVFDLAVGQRRAVIQGAVELGAQTVGFGQVEEADLVAAHFFALVVENGLGGDHGVAGCLVGGIICVGGVGGVGTSGKAHYHEHSQKHREAFFQ